MESLVLGDELLTSAKLVKFARLKSPAVKVSDKARERLQGFRRIVDDAVKSGKTFYGLNTGFGFLAKVRIEKDKLEDLQYGLIRSHSCGVGDPVSDEISRGLLLLRAHTFLLGHSGISPRTLDAILEFVKKDILPIVPDKGSVGASGDLAPLAHVALSLIGEGEVRYKGEKIDTIKALELSDTKPLKLGPKEGLSLINGTQFMTAIGAFAVEEAKEISFAADVVAAMTLDACRGTLAAFDKRIHEVRHQAGQTFVAERIRGLFKEPDAIMESHADCDRVQDPYSLRCISQVHGASLDCLNYVEKVVNQELNSVTDNPLVFENGDMISGGNFHGQPVAMAMDFLAIAMAELGSISEQRLQKLTNPEMSGLPAFIIKDSGLNSGYMIPHVVCAALVSENKIYCHPACVDSIPTSADKEDHVSMGPIAARKARVVIHNVARILAIELLGACQGIDLLAPLKPNATLSKIHQAVRKLSPYMDKDRSLQSDIDKVTNWILKGGVRETLQ